MKKLFTLFFLLIGTTCFAIEPLTDEVIHQVNGPLLVRYMEKQERELAASYNFNKDFEVFFLNLTKVSDFISNSLDVELSDTVKYEYKTIEGTDLFLVSDCNWSFVVPNTIYLSRRYYQSLDFFWRSLFDVLNNGVYYGVLSDRMLSKDAVYSDYFTLIQMRRFYQKYWIGRYIEEYDWFIKHGSIEL